MVGQSSISLVLVHVLEWVLSRQGWEKRYKKEKRRLLGPFQLCLFPFVFYSHEMMFWLFFLLLHTIQGADAQIYFWLLQYTNFNDQFLHFFILMIKAWTKIVPWPRVRYHELLIQIMYSFWDRFRNFLHKFTWIVLSVHNLNKLGKFW